MINIKFVTTLDKKYFIENNDFGEQLVNKLPEDVKQQLVDGVHKEDARVLIVGPFGSGKSRLMRWMLDQMQDQTSGVFAIYGDVVYDQQDYTVIKKDVDESKILFVDEVLNKDILQTCVDSLDIYKRYFMTSYGEDRQSAYDFLMSRVDVEDPIEFREELDKKFNLVVVMGRVNGEVYIKTISKRVKTEEGSEVFTYI